MSEILHPAALVDLPADTQVQGLNVGPSWELYLLTSRGLLRVSDAHTDVLPVAIQDVRFVQPLPGDELLLVNARSRRTLTGEEIPNARIVGPNGVVTREFSLGDAIESVQTTGPGEIWVSYFDEGLRDRLGQAGLACFNASGGQIYNYNHQFGFDILDCYALNVASDREVWAYYYTPFALVRIWDRTQVTRYACPIQGARTIAVFGGHVLMDGGYYDQTTFHLFRLGEDTMTEKATFRVEVAPPDFIAARGRYIFFLQGPTVHRLDVRDLV